jgi:hypothetical protein
MTELSSDLIDTLSGLEETSTALKKFTFPPFRPIRFETEIKRIRASMSKKDKEKVLPPVEQKSLQETWNRVKASGRFEELTRSDLRDCISIDEIFRDPALFNLMQRKPTPGRRMLRMLMRAYLSFWGKLGSSRLQWANFIRKSLANPELDRLNWQPLKHWRETAPWLFFENAPDKLADVLFDRIGPLPEVATDFLQIESSSDTDSLIDCARRQLLAQTIDLEVNEFARKLDLALTHWVNPKSDHDWLSQLILKVNRSNNTDLVERVKTWFLKADDYGDPRLRFDGKWGGISEESQIVFNSWLSKEDLEFFFAWILPAQEDPQGRSAFWKPYLKHVVRSRVLISDEDRYVRKDKLAEMKKQGKIIPGSIRGSSLFIMETKDCYILEFSQTGNAAYIYGKKEKRFPQVKDRLERLLRYENLRGLSRQDVALGTMIPQLSMSNNCVSENTIRFAHYPPGVWERFVRDWLNRHGIRPEYPVEPR